MEMEMIYSSIVLLTTIFFLYKILNRPNKNLPPSPPSLPILGHLHLLKPPLNHTLQALSHRYGPIFSLRLGRQPVLVVSSSLGAEECFAKNDVVFAKVSSGPILGLQLLQPLVASYGDHLRNLRRVITVLALSGKRIQEAGPIRKEEIHYMIKELYGAPKTGPGKK